MSRYYGKQPVTDPVVLVPVDTPVDDGEDNDTPIDDGEDDYEEEEPLEVDEEFEDSEDDS